MSVPVVRFNTQDQPEFIKELRKRVYRHFKEHKLSKHANLNMKVKTAFMLCLYFMPLIMMLTGVVSTLWPVMLMWALMGFGMSGIGLSVMHDANHGAYSKNPKINNALGYLLTVIGGYHINWRIQHNVLHHSFPNIEGFDEDISNPVLRFSPDQKQKKRFRFQAYYASFFYGIMTIYWLISKDFEGVLRYHKKNLLATQGLTLKTALAQVIGCKIGYLALMVLLPVMVMELPWWQILLGFLMMHFIGGLVLTFIFQSAHVVGETEFYTPNENGSVENSWAIHQMKTTANFANNDPVFTWLIGGLNYQIEHHLFPEICHVHYRSISPIIKKTAAEFNVPYYQYPTFLEALASHFSLLNRLGTEGYDREPASV